ncbi:MAG: DNA internalization-related competence protein ComEC/Rec2 [Magnetococcales bacterium]|nr:DNA internalization-related competence protein ComEC/Rec2 [Magnetococcales bacterium]
MLPPVLYIGAAAPFPKREMAGKWALNTMNPHEKPPDPPANGTRKQAPTALPALFLAWMIVGIIATLPVLADSRAILLTFALLPAGAALWARRETGRTAAAGWVVLAGMIWGGLVVTLPPLTRMAEPLPARGEKITIQAVVADREDRSDSLLLLLDEVTSPAWNPSGMIRVSFHRQSTTVLPGDRVALQVRVRPPSPVTNPGGFDYRQYLLDSGIVATATGKEPPQRIGTTNQWFWNRLRQQTADWIAATLPPSQRGLTEALLLGKRGHLDGELQNALFASGTFHLVAISGMHLTLVAGAVYFLVRLGLTLILPLSRRWDMKRPAALLSLVPVTAYAALAGWSVSTQRAYIMVALFMLAVALQRQRHSWRLLTLAAVVLLSWHPNDLLNAGFQLSFLCVAVILYLLDHLPGHTWRDRVVLTLGSTVAIGLVTAPIAQHAFHRVSPYSMAINFVAIPWVGELSTPLGLLAMVVQPLWPELGNGLLRVTGWTLEIYRWLVEWSVLWPGAEMRSAGPSLPGMTCFLAIGFVAAGLRASGGRGWKRGVLALLAVAGLAWPGEQTPAESLRLIVLDVGQALAVVTKMPGGGWSVYDAGGTVSPRFNVGEAVISTALWHHGVKRLERVVLSHPQHDHMAGMTQLLRNFPVGALWLSRLPAQEEKRPELVELLALARQNGVTVRRFDTEESFPDGTAQVRILPPLPAHHATKPNDHSLVMELKHGNHRFLLTGDMEAAQESWLVEQHALQPVTMLLAPHHGSLTSSTARFVDQVHPEHVVFSVGADNPWGFPKPEVLQRWAASGAHLWRTDVNGAIDFLSDGHRLQVTSAR